MVTLSVVLTHLGGRCGVNAKELIARAAACVTCGEEHKPWRKGSVDSWESRKDGHAYRSRIYEMTNNPGGPVIRALRELAGES